MRAFQTNFFLFSCAILLAACGGGGGGGSGSGAAPAPLLDAAAARTLTGASAPAFPPADQQARAPAILARADSLIVSTAFVVTQSPRVPEFQIQADCSGTRCVLSEPETGVSDTVTLQELSLLQGGASAVLTKYGITSVRQRSSDTDSYHSWMEHAAFAVQTSWDFVEGVRLDAHYGLAGGDLAGTRPNEITGTWRGLMVGTPRRGALRGNLLQGDAVLTYTGGASSSLDAAFANIQDLDRGARHATSSVRFEDVPVSAGGTYRAGREGNRIQGGFYGPQHAETAGVFEQADIVGAFGAKRQ